MKILACYRQAYGRYAATMGTILTERGADTLPMLANKLAVAQDPDSITTAFYLLGLLQMRRQYDVFGNPTLRQRIDDALRRLPRQKRNAWETHFWYMLDDVNQWHKPKD